MAKRKVKKVKEPVRNSEVVDNETGTQEQNAQNTAEAGEAKAEPNKVEPDSPQLSEEEKLKLALAASEEKYQRLYADFENFRRRTAKERLEMIGAASTELLKELLPIADDFDRAVANNEKASDMDAIREGMSLVHQKFTRLLERKGVREIDVMHKAFDVDCQEVVTKIPAPKKKYRGKVVDVIEKGYYLNDNILRYAKVVIGE